MVRPDDPELARLLDQFVCVRITRMNDVDLSLFQYDYDLTWMVFLLNGNQRIYSRYGGRDAKDAEGRLSIAGLKYTLRQVLAEHRPQKAVVQVDLSTLPADLVQRLKESGQLGTVSTPPRPPALARDLFAGKEKACIHCHHIWEGLRKQARARGTFDADQLWHVYPLPENVGLTLDVTEGNQVVQVEPGSAAQRAGLRAGDRLASVQGVRAFSQGDVMRGLHLAPAQGAIDLEWRRGEQPHAAKLTPADGWRKTDLSWRASVRRDQ